MVAMTINVYVDSFKLFYGCLKATPYRWLDLAAFCQTSLPNNQINRIRCFTAHVNARPTDPQQPVRQQTYLRALRTISHLTIHLGSYLEKPTRMPWQTRCREDPRPSKY
jgi:hypothetical protein